MRSEKNLLEEGKKQLGLIEQHAKKKKSRHEAQTAKLNRRKRLVNTPSVQTVGGKPKQGSKGMSFSEVKKGLAAKFDGAAISSKGVPNTTKKESCIGVVAIDTNPAVAKCKFILMTCFIVKIRCSSCIFSSLRSFSLIF